MSDQRRQFEILELEERIAPSHWGNWGAQSRRDVGHTDHSHNHSNNQPYHHSNDHQPTDHSDHQQYHHSSSPLQSQPHNHGDAQHWGNQSHSPLTNSNTTVNILNQQTININFSIVVVTGNNNVVVVSQSIH